MKVFFSMVARVSTAALILFCALWLKRDLALECNLFDKLTTDWFA